MKIIKRNGSEVVFDISSITVGQSFVYYLFGYDPWPPGY